MPTADDRLVTAIRGKREREGLSIRALANAIGVSFSTLARIERGEGQPDNNSKVRLLQWLGGDAEAAGLSMEEVAFVHFRAAKNVASSTVRSLLEAAECLRSHYSHLADAQETEVTHDQGPTHTISLSKEELERAAECFRADLSLDEDQPVDSLKLSVAGVLVSRVSEEKCLGKQVSHHLSTRAAGEWSAMSVPLDIQEEQWLVLLNDGHSPERQRVTILEEYWHILLGHKLTKVARVAGAYGRTYDHSEEHDAYYLASATLLPRKAIMKSVARNESSAEIARKFGTSSELVDYRIKRLGLWPSHSRKAVHLVGSS